MRLSKVSILVLCAACDFALIPNASAGEKSGKGEGGPMKRMLEGHPLFDLINKNAAELNITAEQKKQLQQLQDKIDKEREGLRKDPDTRELFKEVMEARKAGDEAKLKDLRAKVHDLLEKKHADEKSTMDQLAKILAPQQLAKLKQLHEVEGGEMGGRLGGGADKPEDHKKPDTAKGAPKLYDDEKK